jgi:hypothetical protein
VVYSARALMRVTGFALLLASCSAAVGGVELYADSLSDDGPAALLLHWGSETMRSGSLNQELAHASCRAFAAAVRVLESRSRPDRPKRKDRRSQLALALKFAGLCRLGRPLDGHVVSARATSLPFPALPSRSDEGIGARQLLKALSLDPRDTMACEYLSYIRLRRADVFGALKVLRRCSAHERMLSRPRPPTAQRSARGRALCVHEQSIVKPAGPVRSSLPNGTQCATHLLSPPRPPLAARKPHQLAQQRRWRRHCDPH